MPKAKTKLPARLKGIFTYIDGPLTGEQYLILNDDTVMAVRDLPEKPRRRVVDGLKKIVGR